MRSIIPTSLAALPSRTTVEYYTISGGANAVTTASQINVIWPISGTIDYFLVNLGAAPGGFTSWTFNLIKNGITSLSVTISNTATSGSNKTQSFHIAAGDTLVFQSSPSGTPAGAVSVSYAFRFTSDNYNQSSLVHSNQQQLTAGINNFCAFSGDPQTNPTYGNVDSVIPTAGSFSNLYILLDTASVGNTFTATVYKNSLATSIVATVPSGGTTASDTTHSVSVSAGDTIGIRVVNNSASSTPRITTGLCWSPTQDGEYIIFTGQNTTLAQNTTAYNSFAPGSGAWTATESTRTSTLIACQLKKFYLAGSNITSGQTFTGNIRVNSLTSSLTTTITGPATTNNDSTDIVSTHDNDLLDLQGITSATTGTVSQPKGSLVVFTPPLKLRKLMGIGL